MVEAKSEVAYVGGYDDGSDDSPPLVEASHVVPELDSLEPMVVSVVHVTIDGADDPLSQASVISSDSIQAVASVEGNDPEPNVSARKWSAGIAGGVLGTLLGGPVLGAVAGGTAAYFSNKDGAAGDVSRAMADVADTTGQKAKELNEKHRLLDKSKQAAEDAWIKVKDLNQEHKIGERSQKAAKKAWKKTKEFDKKHRVVDRITALSVLCFRKIIQLMEHVAGRLKQIEYNQPDGLAPRKVVQPVGPAATIY